MFCKDIDAFIRVALYSIALADVAVCDSDISDDCTLVACERWRFEGTPTKAYIDVLYDQECVHIEGEDWTSCSSWVRIDGILVTPIGLVDSSLAGLVFMFGGLMMSRPMMIAFMSSNGIVVTTEELDYVSPRSRGGAK